MALDPHQIIKDHEVEAAPSIPLAGTRADRLQRLQIGVAGIVAVVLMIGLADIVISRAQLTEEVTVPDAAPTVEPSEEPTPRDPLSDVGVLPDNPTEPATEGADAAPAPSTGDVPPANAPLQ